jgi:hypothetical protein
MARIQSKKPDRPPEYVSVDKCADILQATFKHYFDMALDHHTKAGTTSSMLLIIVGAVIGFVGFDNLIGGMVDFVGGFAVMTIGLFGTVWAWKQHERYHYWEHIAYEYQQELIRIMPGLKTAETGSAYDRAARNHSVTLFPRFIARVKDRYLWVWLHIFVAVIGIALMVMSV